MVPRKKMKTNNQDISPADDRLPVWIVEDNDDYRTKLARLLSLSDEFVCPHHFRSCELALEALGEEAIVPHAILMDIGLPGINGIEGTRKIKALTPAVQIVILSVFEDSDNIVHAIASGASGYLIKSAPFDEIIESLKSIVNGGAPVNPHIARKILDMFALASAPRGDYGLTKRENEILTHLVEDLSQKQIADRLFVSPHTVNMHLRNIYAKLQVQSKSGAIAKALKERLV